MNIDFVDEQELKDSIKECLQNILGDDYNIFIFGSRVVGNNMTRSDIDIGVEGPDALPSSILNDTKEALNKLPYLYKFDLVDFNRVDDKFKRIAKQNIEKL